MTPAQSAACKATIASTLRSLAAEVDRQRVKLKAYGWLGVERSRLDDAAESCRVVAGQL